MGGGGRRGCKRELDKEERREGVWSERRGGREVPAGLSWPWGGSGVFIHPAPKHDGGGRRRRGAALKSCPLSHPQQLLNVFNAFFKQISTTTF